MSADAEALNSILLIDDNPVQLSIREQVLRGAGLEVLIATSGETALALLRTSVGKKVGVIITDHLMEGLSGADFVRRLRRMDRFLPVIVLSGLAEAENEYQGLNVAFRQKPCPPPELIQLVKMSLQNAA